MMTTPTSQTAGTGPNSSLNPSPNFDHDPRFDEGGEFHAEANTTPAPAAGASHTPGPWTVEVYDNEAFILNSGPSAPRGITSISLKYAGLNYSESLANARLIASAPELLAALETLIPHVLHYAVHQHASSDAAKDAANARAIVAKAKGAQQ